MKLAKRLIRNQSGAAVIEAAFVLPILIAMLWMIVQAGLVFRAMGGIQHALGEGARQATLFPYVPPSTTNRAIVNRMNAAVYGIGPGQFNVPDPVAGTEDGSDYLDLTVTYRQPTDFLIYPGPTIVVTRSKRVWVAETS